MLHIAICDDEKDFVTYLTELVNRYAAETGEEIKVSVFYDGMELTAHYDTTIDLIFLDIQMKMVNGLRTAERIRQMDEKVGIIFFDDPHAVCAGGLQVSGGKLHYQPQSAFAHGAGEHYLLQEYEGIVAGAGTAWICALPYQLHREFVFCERSQKAGDYTGYRGDNPNQPA